MKITMRKRYINLCNFFGDYFLYIWFVVVIFAMANLTDIGCS